MNEEKLEKLKVKFPEMRYSVYCHFKDLKIADIAIARLYNLDIRALNKFVAAHEAILGKRVVTNEEV